MTGEIGQLSLCLALALAVVMSIAGLAGVSERADRARRVATSASIGFAVFVALAFGALTYAFIVSDFSIVDVASNSHTAKPLIYKISGVWGNHEGSMLLWVLVLGIYAAFVAFAQRGGERLTSAALGVQGLLATAFLLFILLTSNPFLRFDPPPFEGAGLNPLLQDPGLAFHPPLLYFGYVGLSAAFSYAAAALLANQADAAWARAARPFMLVAWIALTLGITLGSWWAYYELGWGGFWFWDPVENAALMPWLIATALLHSALATERTGAFRTWTLLLAIAAFSLSLLGTFLVRSGVLASVHAFANDPARGQFILGMLVVAIGGALALFAWRAPSLESGTAFDTFSRETFLLINNVLLTGATAAVFIGTLYPLFLDAATGTKLSVGPPYFAITFAPVFIILLLLVPIGPGIAWARADARGLWLRLRIPLAVSALVAMLVLVLGAPRGFLAAACLGLATWVITSSAQALWSQRKANVLRLEQIASALAHAGLGITLMGIAGTTLWRSEASQELAPGESLDIAGYTLTLEKLETVAGPNYVAERGLIRVSSNGHVLGVLDPEKRAFPAEGQATTETGIRTTGFSDLYVALGDQSGNRRMLRAYVNPLAPFIWFGGAFMALGGIAGLWSRLRRRSAVRGEAMAAAE